MGKVNEEAGADLGRALEEDLLIHSDRIRDFGTERPLKPSDVVIEHGAPADAAQAALWLRRQTGASPELMGWRALQPGKGRGPEGSGGGDGDDEDVDPKDLEFCALQDQSDSGNGQRLLRYFGGEILRVRDVGPHVWSGSHWEPTGAEDALLRKAQRIGQRIKLEPNVMAPFRGEDEKAFDKRKASRGAFGVSSRNFFRLRNMIDCAFSHRTVAPEEMDAQELAINVANGTLRLAKEPFKEEDPDCPDPDVVRYVEGVRWAVRLDAHRREDRFAKIAPVAYDATAECPKWLAFVERFQPKESIRRFLQAFHGYALTALVGEQCFVYNYGLGANGKSTFMEAVARLMGSYAQVLPSEALTGDLQRRGDQATPDLARLTGARLVRCGEMPRGQGVREATLKTLTGGEPIAVRHLHKGFFDLRPVFKAIGSGNDRPSIGGVDEGIWRRIKLVPWEVTIPPAERRPMERVLRDFAAEGPGILNWLLEGLLDYLENGLVVPPEIQVATNSYRSDMDPVGGFCDACVVVEEGANVTARDLYNAYVDWCTANSVKAWAEKTFASVMMQKGYRKEKGRIIRYLDIALNDVPFNPDRQAF